MLSLILVGDRLYYLAETVTLATILLPIKLLEKDQGKLVEKSSSIF